MPKSSTPSSKTNKRAARRQPFTHRRRPVDATYDQSHQHSSTRYLLSGSIYGARTPASADRLPYAIRGRVEIAIFNCPRCALPLRFRSRTAISQRCPGCYLTFYLGLRVCIVGGTGGRWPTGAKRPPDTVLMVPPTTDVAAAAELPDSEPDSEPRSRRTSRTHAPEARNTEPAVIDDVLIAELDDESIDPMPLLVLGVWEPGTPINELAVYDTEPFEPAGGSGSSHATTSELPEE